MLHPRQTNKYFQTTIDLVLLARFDNSVGMEKWKGTQYIHAQVFVSILYKLHPCNRTVRNFLPVNFILKPEVISVT